MFNNKSTFGFRKFAISFLTGTAAGIIAGLIIAPKLSRKTQREISKGFDRVVDKVEEKVEDVAAKLRKVIYTSHSSRAPAGSPRTRVCHRRGCPAFGLQVGKRPC